MSKIDNLYSATNYYNNSVQQKRKEKNASKAVKNEQAEELIIYDYLNENIETKYILLFLIVFLPIMSLLLLLSKYVLSKK